MCMFCGRGCYNFDEMARGLHLLDIVQNKKLFQLFAFAFGVFPDTMLPTNFSAFEVLLPVFLNLFPLLLISR